jgi:hypothetical protein
MAPILLSRAQNAIGRPAEKHRREVRVFAALPQAYDDRAPTSVASRR